jgi:hypothetical protein
MSSMYVAHHLSYPRKYTCCFWNSWKNIGSKTQVPFVRWVVILVGFYPSGRHFFRLVRFQRSCLYCSYLIRPFELSFSRIAPSSLFIISRAGAKLEKSFIFSSPGAQIVSWLVNPASTSYARERCQQRLARRREQGVDGKGAYFLVLFVPEPLRLFKSAPATANDTFICRLRQREAGLSCLCAC